MVRVAARQLQPRTMRHRRAQDREWMPALQAEVEILYSLKPSQLSNTLLAIPGSSLSSFSKFHDVAKRAKEWLAEEGPRCKSDGTRAAYHLAFFHPRLRFGDSIQSADHYVGKSPFPVLHLLRSPELKDAEYSTDLKAISSRNMYKLRSIDSSAERAPAEDSDAYQHMVGAFLDASFGGLCPHDVAAGTVSDEEGASTHQYHRGRRVRKLSRRRRPAPQAGSVEVQAEAVAYADAVVAINSCDPIRRDELTTQEYEWLGRHARALRKALTLEHQRRN